MAKSCGGWYWRLGLASLVVIGGAIASSGDYAHAQVTPDGTLGAESSVVTPTNVNGLPGEQIDGGATRGANLFHSFEQFSIPTGGEAFFNNALDIQNIISRVTGLSISNIDGLLRANGTANLFLLNPNGIIFGPNATLNIGGSFVGSTASAVNFADGTFSATAPTTTPLLTVSVPLGLQYGANPGRIQVQGDGQGLRTTTDVIDTTTGGLRVQPNQTIALVGGDIELAGGTVKAAGGRIELGSVAGAGRVNFTPTNRGWALEYEGVPSFGDIQLSGAATVDAGGAGGGDIQVRGRGVTLTNRSRIQSSTLGAEPGGTLSIATGWLTVQGGAQVSASTRGTGDGGTLSVSASDVVEVIGRSADGEFASGLYAQVNQGAAGDGGDLTIATGRLTVQGGAVVSASTFGTGDGGTLSVSASDVVEVIGRSADGEFASGLFAQVNQGAAGDGGDLTIATGRLTVQGGAQVSVSTSGTGDGGTLSVSASDVVEVIGRSADGEFASGLFARANRGAEGDGGDLTIATGRLTVQGGAVVTASTFSTGDGGTLSVNASDVVEVIGRSADGEFASGLFAQVNQGAEGDGGDLTIATGRLTVQGGAQVSASTSGTGDGGTLSVSASDVVEVIGRSADGEFASGLFARANRGAEGDGGDLTIATGRLTVQGGAVVTASTFSTGDGGTLSVNASDVVEVIGRSADGEFASGLFADTQGDGNAGDLTIATGRLTVQGGAQVSASTSGTGDGGTLSVSASDVVEVIGRSADGEFASGLYARANRGAEGDGGDLTIATGRLTVQGGAVVSASTFSTGDGGTLSVSASDVVEVIGRSADGEFASGLSVQVNQGAEGDGGDLTIATGRLTVQGGAQVSASTSGTGDGGTLSVSASDVVELIGRSADGEFGSALSTGVNRGAEGDGGDLTIATGRLTVQGGAQVSASTFSTGDGGTLSVSASDVVELIGRSADGEFPSGLYAQVNRGAEGDGGDLTIATGRLTVQGGAQVSARTLGTGSGGRLSVSASDVVELIGRSADGQGASGLFADTQGDGNAGDLTIATGRLTVQGGAQVTVRSRGAGNAGELRVKAGSVLLENEGKLLASTASGEGGNIELQVQDLILMRGNSLISAEADGSGNGGNIRINAPFIVAVPAENSDIFANAIQGRGGKIEITTQGIYGLEYSLNPTSESDINASSEFGLSGTVEINTPDVDPTQGLVELPAELVDASNQIATGCAAGAENEFIITGRGGLPPNPRQVLRSNAVQVDWVELSAARDNRSSTKPATNPTTARTPTQIVEANGWTINDKGDVVFTASTPTTTLNIPWLPSSDCNAPESKS